MRSWKNLLSLWLLCLATVSGAGVSYGQEIRLTDEDKAAIIKSVLLKENLLKRGLRLREVRGIVYLSTENIAPDLVPQIRDVRLILLDPRDKDNWPEFGFSLFEFSQFGVKGSRVKISLTASWSNDSLQFDRSDYEFRKRSGRWIGRRVGGGLGDSGYIFPTKPNIGIQRTRN